MNPTPLLRPQRSLHSHQGGLLVEALVALTLVLLAGLAALTLEAATRSTFAAAAAQQAQLTQLRAAVDARHPVLEGAAGAAAPVAEASALATLQEDSRPWTASPVPSGPVEVLETAWRAPLSVPSRRSLDAQVLTLQWPLGMSQWSAALLAASSRATGPGASLPWWPESAAAARGWGDAEGEGDGDGDGEDRADGARPPVPERPDGDGAPIGEAPAGPRAELPERVPHAGRSPLSPLAPPRPQAAARFEAAWRAALRPGSATALRDGWRLQSGALRVDPAVLRDPARVAQLQGWIARVVDAGTPDTAGSAPLESQRPPLCDIQPVGGLDPHLAWRCLGSSGAAEVFLLPSIGLSAAFVLCRFEVQAPGSRSAPRLIAPAPRAHAWIGLGGESCPPSAVLA